MIDKIKILIKITFGFNHNFDFNSDLISNKKNPITVMEIK